MNRLMCGISAKIIVVTDSSKFDRRGFYVICDLERLDILVTDPGLPPACAATLERAGVELVMVDD